MSRDVFEHIDKIKKFMFHAMRIIRQIIMNRFLFIELIIEISKCKQW